MRPREFPSAPPLVAGLLALLTGAVLACSAPEPAPPPAADPLLEYEAYLDALKAGDVAGALARSWRPRGARLRQESEARLVEATKLLADGTLQIEPVEARSDGQWALVVIRVSQRTPMGEAIMLRDELLLGSSGRWLVVARSRLGDDELASRRDTSFVSLRDWFLDSDEELSARWLSELGPAQVP